MTVTFQYTQSSTLMMMMMKPALSSAAPVLLLLLLFPVALTHYGPVRFQLKVLDSVHNTPPVSYKMSVAYRGILIGGMKNLMDDPGSNFNFTYTEDPNYGPFLTSVNGLAGNIEDRTYWQLQIKSPDGKITTPDVGIGCYIPNAGDTVILNFTRW